MRKKLKLKIGEGPQKMYNESEESEKESLQ